MIGSVHLVTALQKELQMVYEYNASLVSENKIPNHNFDAIIVETKRLAIENSFLEPDGFLKISKVSNTVNELKKFLTKFKIYFPSLYQLSEQTTHTEVIVTSIESIITPYAQVADKASPTLRQIRKDIGTIRAKIGQSFTSALSGAVGLGYLDDIKETIVDNQRVLAVTAMHRKKIKGSLLGASKSGNIVYIAPEATLRYHRELQNLMYEENIEVVRILKELSTEIRPFIGLLESYMQLLIHLDVIGAKAKYAKDINAVLPKISSEKKIEFKNESN